MKARVGWLIFGTITLWVLLAVPARRLWGDESAVCGAIAALLCLVPSAATFLWAVSNPGRTPDQQLLIVMGGSGIRLFTALAGALVMMALAPELFERGGFWVWLLIFYLFTLALEMTAILKGREAGKVPGDAGNAPKLADPA